MKNYVFCTIIIMLSGYIGFDTLLGNRHQPETATAYPLPTPIACGLPLAELNLED